MLLKSYFELFIFVNGVVIVVVCREYVFLQQIFQAQKEREGEMQLFNVFVYAKYGEDSSYNFTTTTKAHKLLSR